MYKKIFIIALSLLPTLFFSALVHAEEITVSGNGAESVNTVTSEQSQAATVNQENTANIDNSVNVDANTGGNDANDNTGGDVTIDTGNIDVSTTIENGPINVSDVNVGCCPQGGSGINISGNGEGSANTVNSTNNSTTAITVNNNAYIDNDVYGDANTGWNDANSNTGGDVSITTGNIRVSDIIKNKSINIYGISASVGLAHDLSIKISGNGADSVNTVLANLTNSTTVVANNSATVNNHVSWDLNTGKNDANNNTGGNVSITTGDIIVDTLIENGPINVGIIDVSCCKAPGEQPPTITPPSVGGSSSSGGGGGGTSEGAKAVLAAVLTPVQAILPATGSLWMLLMTFGSLIMLLYGWYLRLRSGRSPGVS